MVNRTPNDKINSAGNIVSLCYYSKPSPLLLQRNKLYIC